jgi:predicted acyltransferase
VAGLVATAAGCVWGFWFPINKSLWTSSYVWFTGGNAAIFLAACYVVIDVVGWKRWSRPFVVLGLNAIALFVLSGLIAKTLTLIKLTGADGKAVTLRSIVYQSWFVPLGDPYNASLLFALANLVLLYGVLYWMDRRGLYLKA